MVPQNRSGRRRTAADDRKKRTNRKHLRQEAPGQTCRRNGPMEKEQDSILQFLVQPGLEKKEGEKIPAAMFLSYTREETKDPEGG